MKYTRKVKRQLIKQIQSNIQTIEDEINRYSQPLKEIQGLYSGMLMELANDDVDDQFMERQTKRIAKIYERIRK